MTTTEIAPPESTPSSPSSPGARRHRRVGRVAVWLVRAVAMTALSLVVGFFALQFGLRWFGPHAWHGTVFPSPEPAAPLDGLVLDDGTPADLAAWRGDVVVLYFGYTNCPDVCPTTLSVAADAIGSLGDAAADVHLVMVSVDPARDTLDRLGPYLKSFHPGFAGAGGDPDAIADAAALYGVFYELHEPDADGWYLVDHSATLLGIDAAGDLKVVWNPDVSADDLAADLNELLG